MMRSDRDQVSGHRIYFRKNISFAVNTLPLSWRNDTEKGAFCLTAGRLGVQQGFQGIEGGNTDRSGIFFSLVFVHSSPAPSIHLPVSFLVAAPHFLVFFIKKPAIQEESCGAVENEGNSSG